MFENTLLRGHHFLCYVVLEGKINLTLFIHSDERRSRSDVRGIKYHHNCVSEL